jgi:hypothetical protein|tara:strand:+ start:175 stop:582 length:408 start_codon:yes stop_codon:yes gene_type:complete
MVRYTNAMVEEFKMTLFTDIVDGQEVFNQKGFDDWMTMQEAKGNTFPKARTGKVVDNNTIITLKNSFTKAIKKLPNVTTTGKKGYVIDGNNQLIQVQPLFRVVEADKAGVSEKKFKEIYKATAKAQNIKTPKPDK